GEIKIAGIENSRQIDQVDPSRIDAMASTFNALRSIIDKIMQKKMAPNSPGARRCNALNQRWPRATLRGAWIIYCRKHALFGQVTEERSLKLLIELVNETIFHEVQVRREGTLARARPLAKLATPFTT
ncbi:hypothetical protein ABHI18_011838, partial [Aspergillus niger]